MILLWYPTIPHSRHSPTLNWEEKKPNLWMCSWWPVTEEHCHLRRRNEFHSKGPEQVHGELGSGLRQRHWSCTSGQWRIPAKPQRMKVPGLSLHSRKGLGRTTMKRMRTVESRLYSWMGHNKNYTLKKIHLGGWRREWIGVSGTMPTPADNLEPSSLSFPANSTHSFAGKVKESKQLQFLDLSVGSKMGPANLLALG